MAMRELLIGHIRLEDNLADQQTKVFTGWKKKHLVSLVLYDIYGEVT